MANKVEKETKIGYKILGKSVNQVKIKSNATDKGGNFYIYDMYDNDNKLMALNRYCFTDNIKLPFDILTEEEELILNPIIKEVDFNDKLSKFEVI